VLDEAFGGTTLEQFCHVSCMLVPLGVNGNTITLEDVELMVKQGVATEYFNRGDVMNSCSQRLMVRVATAGPRPVDGVQGG
jgi:hypothetical protein